MLKGHKNIVMNTKSCSCALIFCHHLKHNGIISEGDLEIQKRVLEFRILPHLFSNKIGFFSHFRMTQLTVAVILQKIGFSYPKQLQKFRSVLINRSRFLTQLYQCTGRAIALPLTSVFVAVLTSSVASALAKC